MRLSRPLLVLAMALALPPATAAVTDAAPPPRAPGLIAFQPEDVAQIRTMRVGGAGQTVIAEGTRPVWSPDGTRIAFESSIAARTYVDVIDADGANLHVLTRGFGPVWSPDGASLAFLRPARPYGSTLYTMRADGRRIQEIGLGTDPSWSPDGSRVAFLRAFELWTAASDGTGAVQLTHTTPPGGIGGVRQESWAPDGSGIAYLSATTLPDASGLFVISPDGSTWARLLAEAVGGGLTWSPDSAHLAFVTSMSGDCVTQASLTVVDRDGSGERSVPGGLGIATPRFSPDGSAVLAAITVEDETLPSCDFTSHAELAVLPLDLVGGAAPSWRFLGVHASTADWQSVSCTVVGSSGPDALVGTSGDDVICGLGGDDTVAGLGGDDTLDGGPGTDTLDLSSSPGPVQVDLTTLSASGDGADSVVGVEDVVGSSFADALLGDPGPNILDGGGDADLVDGVAGLDLLHGGPGSDVLQMGYGVFGSAGTLDGGEGTDLVRMRGSTELDLGAGTATSSGQLTWHVLGIEDVSGTPYTDVIRGDAGSNVIWGRGARDLVYGLEGDDTLLGGAGDDRLGGGLGTDRCVGGPGVDQLVGCEVT